MYSISIDLYSINPVRFHHWISLKYKTSQLSNPVTSFVLQERYNNNKSEDCAATGAQGLQRFKTSNMPENPTVHHDLSIIFYDILWLDVYLFLFYLCFCSWSWTVKTPCCSQSQAQRKCWQLFEYRGLKWHGSWVKQYVQIIWQMWEKTCSWSFAETIIVSLLRKPMEIKWKSRN